MKQLAHINNYLKITEYISTAGQPSEKEFFSIRDQNFRTVINLGLHDTSYSLINEAELVSSIGMQYIHIPVEFENPQYEDYDKFEIRMRALKSTHVFIHCAANKRASVFVALYLMREHAWSKSKAITKVNSMWSLNDCWKIFITNVINDVNA